MAIRFLNTMTRQLEEFKPRHEGKAEIYTCGPTVHDFAHIGNFRTYVFEDLLRRYLKYRGYQVKQVMNLTDVDDKIIAKSQKLKMNYLEYSSKYSQAFFEDLKTLNIEPAEAYPRASECVDKMVEIIRELIKRGIAYRSEDGSVYYDIAKFPSYGKLAHIEVEQLQAGARVAQDEYDKDHACDFALWKAWEERDGDVFWDQYEDIGKGRPGWHIECSAMSLIHLGEQFDIHCGGVDNIFPHHQNEIAQSEAYTGKQFVNYWLHSEHLQVDNEKMSKSLGNFFTVRDLLDASKNPAKRAFDPMLIRYALLSVPYRSRLNFRFEGLVQAEKSLERLTDFLLRCKEQTGGAAHEAVAGLVVKAREGFIAALDEDLNIAEGLARLFELVSEGYKLIAAGDIGKAGGQAFLDLFFEVDAVLGLQLAKRIEDEVDPEVAGWIEERQQARKDKNWPKADEMRKLLLSRGIVLEDTPQGVRIKKVTPA